MKKAYELTINENGKTYTVLVDEKKKRRLQSLQGLVIKNIREVKTYVRRK